MTKIKPLRRYGKLDSECSAFINKYFRENIKPIIISAMKKEGIVRIQECNSYVFFDLKDGTSIIDSDFNEKQDRFYERYISPLMDKYHLAHRIYLNIKAK